MFSGIVEELGQVKELSRRGRFSRLVVEAEHVLSDVKIGDSVSVNGACLTVVQKLTDALVFEVMPQTLKITNLGLLRTAEKVNLERSLKIGDRICGHFVSGHIDCIGVVRRRGYTSGNLCFEIGIPPAFIKYYYPRAAVALDGISLTVASVSSNTFCVFVIPHTLKNTTLGFKAHSDKVNVEFDMLNKVPRQ
ncbi:MAG: riboflavin synthase [Candidatus Omnitrophota bacterium]